MRTSVSELAATMDPLIMMSLWRVSVGKSHRQSHFIIVLCILVKNEKDVFAVFSCGKACKSIHSSGGGGAAENSDPRASPFDQGPKIL